MRFGHARFAAHPSASSLSKEFDSTNLADAFVRSWTVRLSSVFGMPSSALWGPVPRSSGWEGVLDEVAPGHLASLGRSPVLAEVRGSVNRLEVSNPIVGVVAVSVVNVVLRWDGAPKGLPLCAMQELAIRCGEVPAH